MNTATRFRCQTGGRRTGTLRFLASILLAGVLTSRPGQAAPPEPPAWQRELDVLRLAEATAAVATASRPAQEAGVDRRLDELYRRLAARYPDRAAVRKAAGDHFWRTGDTGTAVAEWQAAQALDPADGETASALGSADLRDGRTRAALAQFQRAVDACPDVARYHFDLANTLFVFRHEFVGLPALPDEPAILRAALAHFRRASELAAENVDYAQAYAETFYGVPDPDWAQGFAAWDRVRVLSPRSPEFAVGNLARISLRLGKPEQAETYLDALHGPGFTAIKTSLRRQAEQMKRKAADAAPTP